MNHRITLAITVVKKAYVTALAGLVMASLALSVLGGCDSRGIKSGRYRVPRHLNVPTWFVRPTAES